MLQAIEAFGREDHTSQDVINCYLRLQHGVLFCEYAFRRVAELKAARRDGTAYSYRSAAISFLKFLNNEDVSIDRILPELMEKYEEWLEADLKDNSISAYMRSLRAIYNHAIKEKLYQPENPFIKPFANVYTGYAKTEKRAIDSDSVAKLKGVTIEEKPPRKRLVGKKKVEKKELEEVNEELNEVKGELKEKELQEVKGELQEVKAELPETVKKKELDIHSMEVVRDLFLFCIYAQGMGFSDLANLKKKNIKDGFIRYHRQKTGQLIVVAIENCMMNIINKYADKDSEFVFPILRKYGYCDESIRWEKTKSALAVFNRNLDRLGRLAGIEQHLTSYVARHTWASLASHSGIPTAIISRGMGHESEKTTRIYISSLDSSDVAKANKQILSDLIKNKNEPDAKKLKKGKTIT
jgi:integrase